MTWAHLFFLTLLGAALGSFAALAADRVLRGAPVLTGRSKCRSCETVLAARDLVPLVSWAQLRGRCRHCGAEIPAVLWHAEIVGALIALGAGLVAPDLPRAVLMTLWSTSMLALALADLYRFRLPDALLLPAAALGLALSLVGDGSGWPSIGDRLLLALVGAVAGGGVFWVIRTGYRLLAGREGMGMGDVLLMAAIGLAIDPALLPWVVLLAALAALGLAIRRARQKGRELRRAGRVPFGAALTLSAVVVMLLG